MKIEEQILQKLDYLTQEVAQLKATLAHAPTGASVGSDLTVQEAPRQELMEQIAVSSGNLAKWVKSLDRLMELKEDMMPLGRPMMEEGRSGACFGQIATGPRVG